MKLMRMLALLLALFSHALFADEILGRVVRVADGDTITVLASGGTRPVASAKRRSGVLVGGIERSDSATAVEHKIRLHGIDAPEGGQAYGNAAKSHLSNLVAGRSVRVKWKSRDKYGRILGVVYVDGKDVNLEMLKTGFAWHYKRFDSTPAYAHAERAGWWGEASRRADRCGEASRRAAARLLLLSRRISRRQRNARRQPHARARVRTVARHRLLAFRQFQQTPQPQLRELPQDARLSLPEKRGRALR